MPSAAQLPDNLQALARRNAHEISDNRFDYDVRILIEVLEKDLDPGSTPKSLLQPYRQRTRLGAIILIVVLIGVLAIMGAAFNLWGSAPPELGTETSTLTSQQTAVSQEVQTVRINDARAGGPSRGFFTSTGHIVAYVLPGSTVVSVTWSRDGQTWEGEAQVEDRGGGYIPEDIALLRLREPTAPQILLPIRLSTSLGQGDFVERYVSAQDRAPGTVVEVNVQKQVMTSQDTTVTISRALVTTAISAPTDAGAPLLDDEGRVVALAFGASSLQTVAVPIESIRAEFFDAFP